MKYACEVCGCPSLKLPEEFRNDVQLHCKGCGRQLGTWAEFRERAKALIIAERDGLESGARRSSDPLDEVLWT